MTGGTKKELPKKKIPAEDKPSADDSKNSELRKKYLATKDKVIPEPTVE
jgi:hypothetical protein